MLSEKTQVGHAHEVEIAKQNRKSDNVIVVKILRNGRVAKGIGHTVLNTEPTCKRG
jgi:uncharacterized Fe-S center protein